jgi:hypothetical protein
MARVVVDGVVPDAEVGAIELMLSQGVEGETLAVKAKFVPELVTAKLIVLGSGPNCW